MYIILYMYIYYFVGDFTSVLSFLKKKKNTYNNNIEESILAHYQELKKIEEDEVDDLVERFARSEMLPGTTSRVSSTSSTSTRVGSSCSDSTGSEMLPGTTSSASNTTTSTSRW